MNFSQSNLLYDISTCRYISKNRCSRGIVFAATNVNFDVFDLTLILHDYLLCSIDNDLNFVQGNQLFL